MVLTISGAKMSFISGTDAQSTHGGLVFDGRFRHFSHSSTFEIGLNFGWKVLEGVVGAAKYLTW